MIKRLPAIWKIFDRYHWVLVFLTSTVIQPRVLHSPCYGFLRPPFSCPPPSPQCLTFTFGLPPVDLASHIAKKRQLPTFFLKIFAFLWTTRWRWGATVVHKLAWKECRAPSLIWDMLWDLFGPPSTNSPHRCITENGYNPGVPVLGVIIAWVIIKGYNWMDKAIVYFILYFCYW